MESSFLSFRFIPEFGFGKGVYYSIFHVIASYNNAGFALWPDNLTRYVGDPIINIGICSLIVIGGLGFTVLIDIWYSRSFSKTIASFQNHDYWNGSAKCDSDDCDFCIGI
ncbi:potassium transporter TrkG [Bacillus paranthracis]